MKRTLVSVTGAQTHHFFCVDPRKWDPIVRDADGTISVFTDRDRAEAAAREIVGVAATVLTVGMGDEKWALFQRAEKHRVVP